MPTGLDVVFSKPAEKDFENILNYIKRDFGSLAAINFKGLVFKFIELIQIFPEIGTLEIRNKNIRAFVLHKRLKVFYDINDGRITILRLFDTRQHPDRRF